MSISFEISDITTLTNKKTIDVRVVGINANGDEMNMASALTSKVKEFVLEYANESDSNKDNNN